MNTETVLYVEDEENDAIFMRYAWKKVGLANPLQVVNDGQQAMRYLAGEGKFTNRAEHPMPCLVLLDLKLPKVSGFEVLKWIRDQPALRTLQVIVFTSSNQSQDIHTAHALHANAYLVKPPDAEGLAQLVTSLKDFWLVHAQPPPDCLQFEE